MHLPSATQDSESQVPDPAAVRATWAAGDPEAAYAEFVPVAEAAVATAGIGPQSRVLAIDLPVTAEPVRATGAHVERVDWRHADLTDLPFEDGAFDAVISTFGHCTQPNPRAVGQQIGRVIRPGGVAALATWHADGTMGRLFTVLRRYAGQVPGVDTPMPWGRTARIAEHVGPALRPVASQVASVPHRANSVEEAWTHVTATYGPVARAIETSQGPRKKAVVEEVLAILKMGYRADIGLVWNRDFILSKLGKG